MQHINPLWRCATFWARPNSISCTGGLHPAAVTDTGTGALRPRAATAPHSETKGGRGASRPRDGRETGARRAAASSTPTLRAPAFPARPAPRPAPALRLAAGARAGAGERRGRSGSCRRRHRSGRRRRGEAAACSRRCGAGLYALSDGACSAAAVPRAWGACPPPSSCVGSAEAR